MDVPLVVVGLGSRISHCRALGGHRRDLRTLVLGYSRAAISPGCSRARSA